MNKKKSKALSFLLAASLLVPSANGIVSAAELRGSGVAAIEQAEGTGEDSSAYGGETTEVVNIKDVKSEEELVKAIEQVKSADDKEIVITQSFKVENTITVNEEGVTIKGAAGVVLTGKQIFMIKENATISNLKFDNDTEGAANFIEISGQSKIAKIEKCEFGGKYLVRVITCDYSSKLEFIGNKVNVPTRSMIVGVTNGSKIIGNTIDLEEEHYPAGDRTGVLSVVAGNTTTNDNDKVTIKGNTFMNANRVIGMDNAKVLASNMDIKNNKFINCRFAVEVDPEDKNKDQSYDLSNNYFQFDGKVSALKVQNAKKRNKNNDYAYIHEGDSAELVLESLKDNKNIVKAYPYYSKLELDSTGNVIESESVEQTAVKVGKNSYNSLEEAIKVINEDTSQNNFEVVLKRDVELRNPINIPKDKIVKITSPSKHKIELMGSDLIQIDKEGTLTLEKVELRSNLSSTNSTSMNYIVQSGNLTIKNCNITATKNVKGITNIVKAGVGVTDVALTLKDSNITVNARGGFVAVGSGSEITGNTFDFINEEYQAIKGQRTGVISLIAKGEKGKVNISNNTFKNANRAIGVDHSTIDGKNLIIKKNKFINTRYAFEVDVRTVQGPNEDPLYNIGKSYDISGNYFEFDGKVSEPKIQDAYSKADDFSYGENSSEVKAKDAEAAGVGLDAWPYYKDKDCNHLSNESYIPSTPSKPVYTHEEIIGSDRYDTAVKIADKLGAYDTVVLVNATSTMSDGLSASGLAGKENGAILLVKKDSIPKVTMDRIKKVKKVYIIGGESAISAKVANEITAANIKVERLGGKTRVETSKIVAEKLGNYKDAFVVNGFKGEADAMSASAVAAKNKAPILLTNGKESTHDKKSGVKYYVIGGNNVVDKSIADKYSAEVLAGKDRYATNREVIDEFYSGSDKLYLANGDKLVDALTASPLAKKDGIVLVNEKSDKSILKGKNTVQVGGMDFEIKFEK